MYTKNPKCTAYAAQCMHAHISITNARAKVNASAMVRQVRAIVKGCGYG